jgi:hypothetical protein
MQALWHWLAALGEVYTRHASRHGPNRLLPVEVLPARGCALGHAEGSGPDESTAEQSMPGVVHPKV